MTLDDCYNDRFVTQWVRVITLTELNVSSRVNTLPYFIDDYYEMPL